MALDDEPTEKVIAEMGPFIRNHLISAHRYAEDALVGLSPMEMHKLHVAQPKGHCHHDMDHDHTHPVRDTAGMSRAIEVLTELRDDLPRDHHERPGVIRAIEVLRTA